MIHPKLWRHDAETSQCMRCIKPFSLLNRRHHCRRCGGIFCGACSAERMWLRPIVDDGDNVDAIENAYAVHSSVSGVSSLGSSSTRPLESIHDDENATPARNTNTASNGQQKCNSNNSAAQRQRAMTATTTTDFSTPKQSNVARGTTQCDAPQAVTDASVGDMDNNNNNNSNSGWSRPPMVPPVALLPPSLAMMRGCDSTTITRKDAPSDGWGCAGTPQRDPSTGVWWYYSRVCTHCSEHLRQVVAERSFNASSVHRDPTEYATPRLHACVRLQAPLSPATSTATPRYFPSQSRPLTESLASAWQNLWASSPHCQLSPSPARGTSPASMWSPNLISGDTPPLRPGESLPPSTPLTPVRLPPPMVSEGVKPTTAEAEAVYATSMPLLRHICTLARRERRVCIIVIDERRGLSSDSGAHSNNIAPIHGSSSTLSSLRSQPRHMTTQVRTLVELFDDVESMNSTSGGSDPVRQIVMPTERAQPPAAVVASRPSSVVSSQMSNTTVTSTATGGTAHRQVQLGVRVLYNPPAMPTDDDSNSNYSPSRSTSIHTAFSSATSPTNRRAPSAASTPFDVHTRLQLVGLSALEGRTAMAGNGIDYHYHPACASLQSLTAPLRKLSVATDGYVVVILRGSGDGPNHKGSITRSSKGRSKSTNSISPSSNDNINDRNTNTPPPVSAAAHSTSSSINSQATSFGAEQLHALHECLAACGGRTPPVCVLDVCPSDARGVGGNAIKPLRRKSSAASSSVNRSPDLRPLGMASAGEILTSSMDGLRSAAKWLGASYRRRSYMKNEGEEVEESALLSPALHTVTAMMLERELETIEDGNYM